MIVQRANVKLLLLSFQIQCINGCLKTLSSTPLLAQTVSQSPTGFSLSESTSGTALVDTGETTVEESISSSQEEDESVKLKELLEESQLLSAQFAINKVSLEIHSRGDSYVLYRYLDVHEHH